MEIETRSIIILFVVFIVVNSLAMFAILNIERQRVDQIVNSLINASTQEAAILDNFEKRFRETDLTIERVRRYAAFTDANLYIRWLNDSQKADFNEKFQQFDCLKFAKDITDLSFNDEELNLKIDEYTLTYYVTNSSMSCQQQDFNIACEKVCE